MPTNLTIKNVPDQVYARLKAAAVMHRRSLNGEVIVSLENVLMPSNEKLKEHRLARARELRAALATSEFNPHDIQILKQQGRA